MQFPANRWIFFTDYTMNSYWGFFTPQYWAIIGNTKSTQLNEMQPFLMLFFTPGLFPSEKKSLSGLSMTINRCLSDFECTHERRADVIWHFWLTSDIWITDCLLIGALCLCVCVCVLHFSQYSPVHSLPGRRLCHREQDVKRGGMGGESFVNWSRSPLVSFSSSLRNTHWVIKQRWWIMVPV